MKVEWIKILFIVSLVSNIFFSFYLINVNKGLWWDEAVYLGLGKNILKGKYFIDVIAPDRESFRCPFLPFLSALAFLLDGEELLRIIILIFSIGGIITTYYLGKILYTKDVGYLSAIFLSSFPLYLFFSQKILTESIFILFFSVSLLTFYLGVEKKRKYLYYCGIFSGLLFLTKYFALILPVFYIVYIMLRRKEKIFLEKEIWIGLGLFFLIALPRFLIDIKYYNNPIGGILKNIEIYGQASEQPFNFFFLNFYEIFEYAILLIPLGLYLLIKNRNPANLLILISIIIPIIYFSLSQHKEIRYLISFSPVYAVCMAYAIERMGKYRSLFIPLILFFIIQGYISGYQRIQQDKNAGLALKEGSLFLKGITKPNEYIMSESSPHTTYYAEKITIKPPRDKENFYSLLQEYNITYILVNVDEPGNPTYLLNELKIKNFEKIKSFTHLETVTIYKKL